MKNIPVILTAVLSQRKTDIIRIRPEMGFSFRDVSALRESNFFSRSMKNYEQIFLPFAPRFFDRMSGLPVLIKPEDLRVDVVEGGFEVVVPLSQRLISSDETVTQLTTDLTRIFEILRVRLSLYVASSDCPTSIRGMINSGGPGFSFRLLKLLWMQRHLVMSRNSVFPDDVTNALVILRENRGISFDNELKLFVTPQKSNYRDVSGDGNSPYNIKYFRTNGTVPALGLYQTHPITLGETMKAFKKQTESDRVDWISNNHWFLDKLDVPMQYLINIGRNFQKAKSLRLDPSSSLSPRSYSSNELGAVPLINWTNNKIWFGYGNTFLKSTRLFDAVSNWQGKRPADSLDRFIKTCEDNVVNLDYKDFVNGFANLSKADWLSESTLQGISRCIYMMEKSYAESLELNSSPFVKTATFYDSINPEGDVIKDLARLTDFVYNKPINIRYE